MPTLAYTPVSDKWASTTRCHKARRVPLLRAAPQHASRAWHPPAHVDTRALELTCLTQLDA
eukprot:1401032-Alexandrium_andersonii.AAC.1